MESEKNSHCHGSASTTRGGASPSRYQAMWLFVMFDLPVATKTERRRICRRPRRSMRYSGVKAIPLDQAIPIDLIRRGSDIRRNRLDADSPAPVAAG